MLCAPQDNLLSLASSVLTPSEESKKLGMKTPQERVSCMHEWPFLGEVSQLFENIPMNLW